MSDANEIYLTAITGPPFVNIIILWTLFGVLSTQVYNYCQGFPNDKVALMALVYGVYMLELVQILLQTETSWSMLVRGFGNLNGMENFIGKIWLSLCVIGGFVTLLVHWFYAYRISMLSQGKMIPGIVILFSVISFAGALGTAVLTERTGQFTTLLAHHESQTFATIVLWGAASAVSDIVITICMLYYLQRQKNNGFSKTQALVSRIIRMTVETGAMTTSVSVLTLALYFSPSFIDLGYYKVPLSASAPFYAVTMLAALNNRMKPRSSSHSITWQLPEDELLTSIRFKSITREADSIKLNGGSTPSLSQSMGVFVTREEMTTTEDSKICYLAPPVH